LAAIVARAALSNITLHHSDFAITERWLIKNPNAGRDSPTDRGLDESRTSSVLF
jgi:hypothetical protein